MHECWVSKNLIHLRMMSTITASSLAGDFHFLKFFGQGEIQCD